jgi:hypothetical protein
MIGLARLLPAKMVKSLLVGNCSSQRADTPAQLQGEAP